MDRQMGIIIVLVLIAACAINANKNKCKSACARVCFSNFFYHHRKWPVPKLFDRQCPLYEVCTVKDSIEKAELGFKRTYNKCLRDQKCRDTVSNRKCCHIGTKLAKHNYQCSVDGVISTQNYLRTLKHKIHSLSSIPVNPLFRKAKKCKKSEDCLHCCCILRKRHILTLRYRMRRLNNYG